MTDQLQTRNSAGGDEATPRVQFIAVCVLAFAASVAATFHFCRSMCCEMEMPGGWRMSMMWMRPRAGFVSAGNFLLMWLAMMVAMMLPSALPMFLNIKRAPASLSVMATGYFAIWLAAGVGIYAFGVAFAAAAMHWATFSRMVPLLLGVALIAAGMIQFTRWKTIALFRCRSPFGCATACPERETNFRLGCKQGAACCFCCAAPTLILVVLGMMNPLVIVGVAMLIAAEKLLPHPEIIARLAGTAAVIAGLMTTLQKLGQ